MRCISIVSDECLTVTTYIPLVFHNQVVIIDSQDIAKVRILVFWNDILPDTLLGSFSDINNGKLVLRRVFVCQEIELRPVVRNADMGGSTLH